MEATILTPVEEKLRRLDGLGVEHVVEARFDEAYLSRSPQSFIKELAKHNPVEVFVGRDFLFGQNWERSLDDLEVRFRVQVVETVCCSRGKVISSTRIRRHIARGEMDEALSLLER